MTGPTPDEEIYREAYASTPGRQPDLVPEAGPLLATGEWRGFVGRVVNLPDAKLNGPLESLAEGEDGTVLVRLASGDEVAVQPTARLLFAQGERPGVSGDHIADSERLDEGL